VGGYTNKRLGRGQVRPLAARDGTGQRCGGRPSAGDKDGAAAQRSACRRCHGPMIPRDGGAEVFGLRFPIAIFASVQIQLE
jgi:hypothetical protein